MCACRAYRHSTERSWRHLNRRSSCLRRDRLVPGHCVDLDLRAQTAAAAEEEAPSAAAAAAEEASVKTAVAGKRYASIRPVIHTKRHTDLRNACAEIAFPHRAFVHGEPHTRVWSAVWRCRKNTPGAWGKRGKPRDSQPTVLHPAVLHCMHWGVDRSHREGLARKHSCRRQCKFKRINSKDRDVSAKISPQKIIFLKRLKPT